MHKDNFITAIKKLKARNQNYVNKYGVTKYSLETDELIKNLTQFYNQAVRAIEKIEALEAKLDILLTIIGLFNIPVEFQDYHAEFLRNELKQRRITDNLVVQPLIYVIDIRSKYAAFNCIVKNMVTDIESMLFARELNLTMLIRQLNQNMHPLLKTLADEKVQTDDNRLYDYLTKEYYAGNVNP